MEFIFYSLLLFISFLFSFSVCCFPCRQDSIIFLFIFESSNKIDILHDSRKIGKSCVLGPSSYNELHKISGVTVKKKTTRINKRMVSVCFLSVSYICKPLLNCLVHIYQKPTIWNGPTVIRNRVLVQSFLVNQYKKTPQRRQHSIMNQCYVTLILHNVPFYFS